MNNRSFCTLRSCLAMPVLAAVLSTAGTAVAQPTVQRRYVDGDIPVSGDGLSWGTAYKYLQDALADAEENANSQNPFQLWVAATVAMNPYRPDRDAAHPGGSDDETRSFHLLDNVRLLGGFAGGEIAEPERDPNLNETVLSGNLGGTNSYHVVVAQAVNDSAVIDGFTIRDGHANGSGSTDNQQGGGILIGGQSFVQPSSPVIRDCKIVSNEAGGGQPLGGGISVVFTGNMSPSTPEIRNCTIADNSSAGPGGGIYAHESPKIINCVIDSNVAQGGLGGGGVFLNQANDAVLVNCVITGNDAGSNLGGGLHLGEFGTPLLGIRVINCLIAGNSASDGGGIYSFKAGEIVINSTIAQNTATFSGGGYFINNSALDEPIRGSVQNTIIWDNSAMGSVAQQQLILVDGSTKTMTYSCIQDEQAGDGSLPYEGEGNIDLDPRFADPVAGNYRLATDEPCSPALNAGYFEQGVIPPPDDYDVDEDTDTMEPTPDLDLHFRVVGTSVEMGAYEMQVGPVCACAADTDLDGDVDVDDLTSIILDWGNCCANNGDVDGDGDVDVDDLTELILGWGDCQRREAPQSVWDCIEKLGNEPMTVIGCFVAEDWFEENN